MAVTLVTLATCLVSLVSLATGQQICEECNCQISSEDAPQAIYPLSLICNTGSITWYDASGAVRLELRPFLHGEQRACFVVESENIHVQVYQELSHVTKPANYRRGQEAERSLKLDHLMTSRSKSGEFCVNSRGDSPMLLYIESVKTPDVVGVPKVIFHYDVEKLDSNVLADPMEECRPCTKEEILDSYCSMDFVVIGQFADVSSNEISDRSDVTVSVQQVIHQREQHYFRRMRRSDHHLTGHVTVPKKCRVGQSEGVFLLTGRGRLGQLALKCAPYLHDWREIQNEAECSHG